MLGVLRYLGQLTKTDRQGLPDMLLFVSWVSFLIDFTHGFLSKLPRFSQSERHCHEFGLLRVVDWLRLGLLDRNQLVWQAGDVSTRYCQLQRCFT